MRKTFYHDGIRYWVRGKDEAECDARIKKRIKELEQGTKERNGRTVAVWSKEWLDVYKKPYVSVNGYNDIERIVNKFILPDIGRMPLKSVRPMDLQKILNGTSEWSQSYCDKIYQTVTGIFRKAYENDLIPSDISKGLTKPKGRTPEYRRALTEAERTACLKACREHYGGLFVMVMYYCGLRPGEVAGLEWRDIDWKNRTLSVSRAVKSGNILGETKTRNGKRKVPIPMPLFTELKKMDKTEVLVLSPTGNRYTKAMMTHMWSGFLEVMQRQDVGHVGTDLTLYCLRHDYCTRLQEAGVPINIAKELMGHSNISTTSRIYTHSTDVSLKNAQKLIEDYF